MCDDILVFTYYYRILSIKFPGQCRRRPRAALPITIGVSSMKAKGSQELCVAI